MHCQEARRERCNKDPERGFYLVDGDGFSVLGLYLPFVASIFRSSWFSRAISFMSFALGLLGAAMFNPLLNFLDTLGFHVPNKIVCIRKTFDPHLCAVLSEKQTHHYEGSSMISSCERM